MLGFNLGICVCEEQDKTKGFGKVQAAQQDVSKHLHNLTTTRYFRENWKSVTRLLAVCSQGYVDCYLIAISLLAPVPRRVRGQRPRYFHPHRDMRLKSHVS